MRTRPLVLLAAATATLAVGLPDLAGVELSDHVDAYKTTSPVVDTTPLGTLERGFETTRALNMEPVVHFEVGNMSDLQFQRRGPGHVVDGEVVTETRDYAFLGLTGFGGARHGIEVVDVTDPANPQSLVDITCGGFHNDIAVWRNLLVIGFDGGPGPCDSMRDALGPQNVPSGSAIFVFDVSDPTELVPVAAFDGVNGDDTLELTDGTHNLGIHPDGILYFATAGFDAVEPDLGIVDLNDVDADTEATMVNMKTISPTATDGCHDLGFSLDRTYHGVVEGPNQVNRDLMVCPAIESTYIWDISDPFAPTEVAAIANPGINIHHGGRFTPDGRTVVLGDELAGAGAPSGCFDGGPVGALWTYDVSLPEAPLPTGYVSASESPGTIETCTSHFYNFLPTSDETTKVVTGWYGSGMVVHDITPLADVEGDVVSATPLGAGPEIAHLEPTDAELWSAYAYYGHVFGGSYTGNTGFFVASLDGYTDSADADLAPWCNDVGIVWGPWTDDWRSECRAPEVELPS